MYTKTECRTDQTSVLKNTPWIRITYPGKQSLRRCLEGRQAVHLLAVLPRVRSDVLN